MKSTFKIPKQLLTSIDVMNTLNGGTSEPQVFVQKFNTHHQITARVPGVSLKSMTIEINDNKLMIFCYASLESQQKQLQFPKFLYNKSIPYFVDAEKITASIEEDGLVVTLPFNSLSNGYHRDISINNN